MKYIFLPLVLMALSLDVQAAKETWLLQDSAPKTVILAPPVKPKPRPFISTAEITPLLAQLYIVDNDELVTSPVIAEQAHEKLISTQGDEIIVDNITQATPKHYLIVEEGTIYHDPKTKKVLGYGLKILAQAKLNRPGVPATEMSATGMPANKKQSKAKLASLHLTKTCEEVQVGDKLVVDRNESLPERITLYKPKKVAGLVVASVAHKEEAASHELIVVNKGKQQGLLPGAMLSIVQPKFSHKVIGSAVVIKSYNNLSLAYITTASRPIKILDKVASAQ